MAEYDTYIAWFETLSSGDIARAGGKNASLGEMIRTLTGEGIRVPDGVATTASAYRDYIAANGIETAMRTHLQMIRDGRATLLDCSPP